MKGPNLQGIWDDLPEDRKQKIQARSQELLTEYETLQELRQALELTQVELADALSVHQVNVSKLEKRGDLKLSTLRDYLSALGGSLKLVVEFPGRDPIVLSGFGNRETPGPTKRKPA
jgi:DNA-binding XRE family transcriptional regulator